MLVMQYSGRTNVNEKWLFWLMVLEAAVHHIRVSMAEQSSHEISKKDTKEQSNNSKDIFPVICFIPLVFPSYFLPLQNNMSWESIHSLCKSLHDLTCENAFTDVPEACLRISLVFFQQTQQIIIINQQKEFSGYQGCSGSRSIITDES